ncbi:hypothetical protein CPBF424_02880 [Xanthomonas euroxanthea]|uniref:Uncharacterized protein n=1 Tax=Xanthomonas euroxanthea TaxID=2259622 RepID=A0AA46H8U3_9XANT|nr:hypothetical protein CPBF424_02880 [Xanthomonas euroxanthea]
MGLSDERADRRMSTCGSVCVLRGIAALAVFTTRRDDGDRVIMPGGDACGPAACSGRGKNTSVMRGELLRWRSVTATGGMRLSQSANTPCSASTNKIARAGSPCRSRGRCCVAGSIRSRPCALNASVSTAPLDLRYAPRRAGALCLQSRLVLACPPSRDLERHGCRARAYTDVLAACPAMVGRQGPCSQAADQPLCNGSIRAVQARAMTAGVTDGSRVGCCALDGC